MQSAGSHIPVVIARFGDVIGPGQHTWTVQFIQKINQGLLRPPSDAASGTLNPVYIDNLLDALLLLGSHPEAVGQAFNVVDGTPLRVSDYIRRLALMAGKRPAAVPSFMLKAAATLLMTWDLLRGREASVTPGDIDYLLHKSTISNEKIRASLGWKPAIDLQDGFRRVEQWLRAEGYVKA